jgi:ribosome biogenesis protein MAK21
MTDTTKINDTKKRRRGRKSGEIPGESNGENVADYQAHNSLLIQLNEEAPTWHEYGKQLPGRNDTISTGPATPSEQVTSKMVSKYRSIADSIFQTELQLFGKNTTRGSDNRWVENTIKKGTLKDRIAAMSVTVSTDPVHKFYALDGLLQMVGCSESGGQTNSRVEQMTAEALEDLFLNTFLPPDRKLVTLAQRPLYLYEADRSGNSTKMTLSPRTLLLWRFEEMVKDKYEHFLRQYMAHTLQGSVDMHKVTTLRSAAKLLRLAPEGEARILAMIVNKLGDPGKKTAASAGHELRRVVQQHPNMQVVIAREVQQLAHRPQLSPKALYNCIVFLNQLKLDKNDEPRTKGGPQEVSLAASLIKTYFRLFEVAVNKPKTKNPKSKDPESTEEAVKSPEAGLKSRLLSALL